MSNRDAAMISTGVLCASGVDVKNITISKSSVHRARTESRKTVNERKQKKN